MRGKVVVCIAFVALLTGWDFSRHSIPLEEIISGGPQKDGIPALTDPMFISGKTAEKRFLKSTDRVLGLHINKKAKAYPVKILNWHEVVNDKLDGVNVLVTYCPLCGTGMVFDANEEAGRKLFGVSGLLFQSDMLLYDQKTESLWSQIMSEAVAGKLTGQKLTLLPSQNTSWKDWKRRHPGTEVLSEDTGFSRDYKNNPYAGYENSGSLYFQVNNKSREYPPKETVIGVKLEGKTRVYPFSELGGSSGFIKDRIGNHSVTVFFDAINKSATVRDGKGQIVPSVMGFWFAWYAFHPDTEIYRRDKR